jgi:hypothetical protein
MSLDILAVFFVMLAAASKSTNGAYTVHTCQSVSLPESSQNEVISPSDQAAIRKVIESQIEALKAGDFERAFSFASPSLKNTLGTAEAFSSSVREPLVPMLKPHAVVFEDLKQVMGILTQGVLLFNQNGEAVVASYLMEKQENGDWKIGGCYLAPLK